MRRIKYILLLCTLISGCGTCRTQLDNKSTKDTNIIMSDTTIIRDSVYKYIETNTHERNDTVFVNRVIYYYTGHERDNTRSLDSIIQIHDTVTVYQLTGGEQRTGVSSSVGAYIILALIVMFLIYIVKKKSK